MEAPVSMTITDVRSTKL